MVDMQDYTPATIRLLHYHQECCSDTAQKAANVPYCVHIVYRQWFKFMELRKTIF